MSDCSSWEFIQPQPKSCPLPAPARDIVPRIRSPFQVSTHSSQVPSPVKASAPYQVSHLSANRPLTIPCVPGPIRKAPEFEPSPISPPARCFSLPRSLQARDSFEVTELPSRSDRFGPSRTQALETPKTGNWPGPRKVVQASTKTLRAKCSSQDALLCAKWHDLLNCFGILSGLFVQTQASIHGMAHSDRILDSIAPSTALKYITSVKNFLRICDALKTPLTTLDDIKLADVLLTVQLSRSSDELKVSCHATIKALRWMSKHAGVRILDCAFSDLVQSFLTRKVPRAKREAPPLPLWTLVQWERRILMNAASTPEIIILGSFLFMLWSGLRFADLQRVTLQDLILDHRNARGWCWRAKTSASGHAFGVVASGFLSRGNRNWLWRFLSTLDSVLGAQSSKTIDFLLPACALQGVIYPLEPMSYAGALAFLRELVHCSWRSQPSPCADCALSFTVHSLKATLLSWGPQLHQEVTREIRLAQGHHKDSNQSLDLYGRDSVWGSLQFQQIIINQVRSGFRPQIAQHRGAQTPLVEPEVSLEAFKKDIPSYEWQWFAFNSPAGERVVEVDLPQSIEDDSSSSDSDSSESSAEPAEPRPTKAQETSMVDEVLMVKFRTVVHASLGALDAMSQSTSRTCIRTACGRQIPSSDAVMIDSVSSTMDLCQHSGCRKAWASLE